jgi:hypothetical protein
MKQQQPHYDLDDPSHQEPLVDDEEGQLDQNSEDELIAY